MEQMHELNWLIFRATHRWDLAMEHAVRGGYRQEAAEAGWWAVEHATQSVMYKESGEYPEFIPLEMNLSEHPSIRNPALERGGAYFEIRESLNHFERRLRPDAHWPASTPIPWGGAARLREVSDYIVLCA